MPSDFKVMDNNGLQVKIRTMRAFRFDTEILSRKITVYLLVACWALIGCSSFGSKSAPVSQLSEYKNKEVELVLKPLVGREEITRYYSHSHIETIEDNQLTREKDEIVEFDVKTKTFKHDKKNNYIHHINETIDKDGLVDLHDLAFPEVKERIEMIFTPKAEVIFAGSFPKSSVFYVPPLSLPEGKVKVGDTWEMDRSWVSMKNSIPLRLNVVTILKGIYPCHGGRCADLEISGTVGIIASLDESVSFNSYTKGRILFSIDKGTILWSLVTGEESMKISENRVDVKSCLMSQLQSPSIEKWTHVSKLQCDPQYDGVITVPGTITNP